MAGVGDVVVVAAADGIAETRGTTMTNGYPDFHPATSARPAKIAAAAALIASAAFAALIAGQASTARAQSPGPGPARAQGAQMAKGARNAPEQKSYATPEAAAQALADAMRADDLRAIHAVLGPGSGPVIFSGDRVADNAMRDDFVEAYEKSHRIERKGDSAATLVIGETDYPVPFPIVKGDDGWRFDARSGVEEVLNRRIGENEDSAIKFCLAYVDAQREYAEVDRDGNGVIEYAQKFVSSPGARDGLYWPTRADEPVSPLGPLAAQARAEGYGRARGDDARGKAGKGKGPGAAGAGGGAFRGYRFKILTGQGRNARGGAYDYIVNGRMIGGFGLVAWPARYGSSGVMTFQCNHDGVVFEKDLGDRTAEMAQATNVFDPDASWKKAEQ